MQILIIKTSSLGDVIHTLPALTDAVTAIPSIQFDWVVEENFAEVPSWHPNVNRIIKVAIRRWRKNPVKAMFSGEWSAFKHAIGCKQYDAVIDAQGLLKSAWLTRYSNGETWGLNKTCAREPLASRFYQHQIEVHKSQHAVERIRQLFAKSLHYEVPQSQGDYGITTVAAPLSNFNNYLVFLHGTTRADKHWPEVYWNKLAIHYSSKGIKILLPWGNQAEHDRANRIATHSNLIKVLPRSTLSELAAIINNAHAVVSVDTGLAHLSAALNVPNITLYGPTDPKLVGTYGRNQQHLCVSQISSNTSNLPLIEPVIFTPLTPDVVISALDNIPIKSYQS